jgi:predicted PurR-regulated permease PerM
VLDAMLINPMVVGKNLNLHPLTIIVGISIGGSLAGILGMLVSIPFIAIGKAIINTVWDAVRRQQAHRRGYV